MKPPYSIPVKPDPEGDALFKRAAEASVQKSEAILGLIALSALIGICTMLYWIVKLALWLIELVL